MAFSLQQIKYTLIATDLDANKANEYILSDINLDANKQKYSE
jgi:hypothetical protein